MIQWNHHFFLLLIYIVFLNFLCCRTCLPFMLPLWDDIALVFLLVVVINTNKFFCRHVGYWGYISRAFYIDPHISWWKVSQESHVFSLIVWCSDDDKTDSFMLSTCCFLCFYILNKLHQHISLKDFPFAFTWLHHIYDSFLHRKCSWYLHLIAKLKASLK